MAKQIIRKIDEYATLYRDDKNGISWIENGKTGLGHSCHANIGASGSVIGMKNLGYWDKEDRVVQSHGFKYNIDSFVIDKEDPYDVIVADECMCQGCLDRRARQIIPLDNNITDSLNVSMDEEIENEM